MKTKLLDFFIISAMLILPFLFYKVGFFDGELNKQRAIEKSYKEGLNRHFEYKIDTVWTPCK